MTRFGLQIPGFTYGVPDAEMFGEVAARAGAAEESGFDSVWVMPTSDVAAVRRAGELLTGTFGA